MFKNLSFSRADIWFILVSLLVISFPWNEKINSVFIILLTAHWLMDKQLPEKIASLKKNWKIILPFWLFFFMHFIFLHNTINQQDAFHTIEVKLSFLFLPLLFSTENYLNTANKRKIFMLFCYSCLLSSIYCIICYRIYFYPLYQWTFLFNRMYYSYYIMHPGYYSDFFVIAIIYLSLEWTGKKPLSIPFKIISLGLIAFFLFTLFILVSKTAIIVLVLFSVFIIWKALGMLKQKSIKYILFTGGTLAMLFAFAMVPSIKNRIIETKRDFAAVDNTVQFTNSTGSRIAAWSLEWDLIKSNWLLGHGTGNANPLLYNKFVSGKYTDLIAYNMHTHNQILHTWIDLGIGGVILLLIIFISCSIRFFKEKNDIGLWTVILLFIYCLTDDALEIQSICVFCICIICLLLFEKNRAQQVYSQSVI